MVSVIVLTSTKSQVRKYWWISQLLINHPEVVYCMYKFVFFCLLLIKFTSSPPSFRLNINRFSLTVFWFGWETFWKVWHLIFYDSKNEKAALSLQFIFNTSWSVPSWLNAIEYVAIWLSQGAKRKEKLQTVVKRFTSLKILTEKSHTHTWTCIRNTYRNRDCHFSFGTSEAKWYIVVYEVESSHTHTQTHL